MAWYWILIIGFVLGGIVGYALVAYAISRGHDFERKGIAPKGHGLDIPWWWIPVYVVVTPFIIIRAFFQGKFRKGEKDPHDISGET